MKLSFHKDIRGMSILEVVIGAAIIMILTTAIGGAWQTYISLTKVSGEKNQASLQIEEASDALRFMRDSSWATNLATLTLNQPYYLVWNNGYSLTSTATTTNNLTRTIVFSSVSRNGQDDISSSGTIDPKTKKVTISVYNNRSPQELLIQSEMLIHDVYSN
jgi:type II secretory pathway pseudopilin PulG